MNYSNRLTVSEGCQFRNIFEDSIGQNGTDWFVVGNKPNGQASYILIKKPSDLPANCVVNLASLTLLEFNYDGYSSGTLLPVKVSRITATGLETCNWPSPAFDNTVFGELDISGLPSSSNYDYRDGYHAKQYQYGKWTFDDNFIKYVYYSTDKGQYFTDGSYAYFYNDTIPAHYDNYYKYRTIDITQVIRDLINLGGDGLIIWFDLPGTNDNRKYFKSTSNATEVYEPLISIDYTAFPAPGLSVDNSIPYEGQGITFTATRPSFYNALTKAGATNSLTYYVELNDGTPLANGSALVTAVSNTISIPYTVGNLTAGIDLSTSVKCYAVDLDGNIFDTSAPLAITIKRFQAPVINAGNITRTDTTATVPVTVQDTGFGDQLNTHLKNSVDYNIGAGWVTASLAWTGLSSSLIISGITSARYSLSIRVTNNKPVLTLSDKTSAAYPTTILELLPVSFDYSISNGKKGTFAQALFVNSTKIDPAKAPATGCAAIEKDMDIGGDYKVGGVKFASTLGANNILYKDILSAAGTTLSDHNIVLAEGDVLEIDVMILSNVNSTNAALSCWVNNDQVAGDYHGSDMYWNGSAMAADTSGNYVASANSNTFWGHARIRITVIAGFAVIESNAERGRSDQGNLIAKWIKLSAANVSRVQLISSAALKVGSAATFRKITNSLAM